MVHEVVPGSRAVHGHGYFKVSDAIQEITSFEIVLCGHTRMDTEFTMPRPSVPPLRMLVFPVALRSKGRRVERLDVQPA